MIILNVRVCISDDYEYGKMFVVFFGGFYSCRNGNFFVNGIVNKICFKGFSNYLVIIDVDCEI